MHACLHSHAPRHSHAQSHMHACLHSHAPSHSHARGGALKKRRQSVRPTDRPSDPKWSSYFLGHLQRARPHTHIHTYTSHTSQTRYKTIHTSTSTSTRYKLHNRILVPNILPSPLPPSRSHIHNIHTYTIHTDTLLALHTYTHATQRYTLQTPHTSTTPLHNASYAREDNMSALLSKRGRRP